MAGKIRTLTGSDILTQSHNYQLTTATNWTRMINDQDAFKAQLKADLRIVEFVVTEIMVYQQFHSRILRAAMNVGLRMPIDSWRFDWRAMKHIDVGLLSRIKKPDTSLVDERVIGLLDVSLMTVDDFMAHYIEASKDGTSHLVMKKALALLCMPFYSGVPKDLCTPKAKIIEERVISPAGLMTYCAISGLPFGTE